MPIGTTGQIIKVILIVILIILLVIEFLSLFVGLAFIVLPGVNKNDVHHGLFMVVVAALLICLAFVGLCGAIRECYLKLFVFAGLLIAVLLVSVLVNLFMLFPENENDEPIDSSNDTMQRSLRISRDTSLIDHYITNNMSSFQMKIWDTVHRKFGCCGLKGPETWWKLNVTLPDSCCHYLEKPSDIPLLACIKKGHGDYVYTRGCFQLNKPAFEGSIAGENDTESTTNITMVTIIRAAGYFIQLAAVVLAIWLGIIILMSYHCGYY